MNTENNETNKKSFFTSLEARVIACLMEKQLTTPNNYPLTLNSLLLACNQKSNREPVMDLTEGQVGHTVNTLKDRGLIDIDYGGRSNHISHRVMNALSLSKKKQAILTVLMVRAPLTLNDIKARTNRMVEFDDLNDVHETLDKMMDGDDPMVVRIPKVAGSREDRFTHLLCGEVIQVQVQNTPIQESPTLGKRVNITQQVKLEQRVATLEEKVSQLMQLLD
jgi:uncharacterized protein YceH (UPF0502 family)